MTKRQITYLLCTTALLGAGLSCSAATAAGPMTRMVSPGDSIQKAVNAAKPGDTIFLSPGTYRESVRVTTSGLTLRGAGPRTVIAPAASSSNACAKAGSGICVEGKDGHPVEDTTIAALTLSGFSKNGLWSSWTNRLTVQQVTAEKNGQWGIGQERSTRGTFVDNTFRDNGDAGLYLANTFTTEAGATDTHGALIGRNRLQGNRIGVTILRLRNLTVATNDMTANCAGVFVIGDENTPRAGALTLSDNYIHKNNKFCPKTARVPIIQGAGIVLTGGTENILMTRNTITDNVGTTSPYSGGIMLFKSWLGVLNERNQVIGNVLQRNAPADLVKADAGKGNNFQGNTCRVSKPAGLC
jgi:hypothetical protein